MSNTGEMLSWHRVDNSNEKMGMQTEKKDDVLPTTVPNMIGDDLICKGKHWTLDTSVKPEFALRFIVRTPSILDCYTMDYGVL